MILKSHLFDALTKHALSESSIEKQKFSALMVVYNDATVIENCLKSLFFCDEIICIDVGSTDGSIDIAKRYGAKIISHPWVPIGEQAKDFGLQQVRYDWVIVIDPDERVSPSLPRQLRALVQKDNNIGYISVRWLFYFKGKRLTCTRWGFPQKIKPLLVHKSRVYFGKNVHSAYHIKPGFEEYRLPYDGTNALHHQWVTQYGEFLQKHWKYVKMEGKAKFEKGMRFQVKNLLYEPMRQFKINLLNMGGLKGGMVGIFLSGFRAFYLFMSELSLLKYQWLQGDKHS